jgi:hypothetical protein
LECRVIAGYAQTFAASVAVFDSLDGALKSLLHDAAVNAALPSLYNAVVSFVTPENGYGPDQETVNLFLYETRENRDLRDPAPITEQRNGLSVRRRPPLRVDCAYMVTAWSKQTGGDKVAAEHQLLGQAFNWLSRFPVIPDRCLLAAGMTGQVFPPPTLVAQMDAAKNVGEFWSALGIPPRPFFNLIVTIAMDLDQALEESLVTTLSTRYHAGDSAGAEERIILGGTVRDRSSRPVADAWVRLEPAGLTQVTDGAGRFIFADVARGAGMTLRARAPGLGEAVRSPVEIPSVTRDYDLNFS